MDGNRLRVMVAGGEGEDRDLSGEVAEGCFEFLKPLLEELDKKIDLRLVRTLANGVMAIVRHRNRPFALLLSELGAYLTGPKRGPAGTKRLGNLLHSEKWEAADIEEYLLEQGKERVEEEAARSPEGRALCILDGSVLEKPEAAKMEGLMPIRSAKARRIARPRPELGKGYFRGKPGGPIVVPGFEWVGALLTGWGEPGEKRPLTLGAWHWYSKPVDEPKDRNSRVVRQKGTEAARSVLDRVVSAWGEDKLLHVWDRGLSSAWWLTDSLEKGWHFVVRWKKGNKLRRADAPSLGDVTASDYRQEQDGIAAWKLTAGLRAWGERRIANPRNPKQPITVSFAAREVRLLHRDDPLWLVVVRLGKATKRRRGGSEPWRLLTTEPVRSAQECWRIVQAYVARWEIEQMLRFGKSELGLESIRVRGWEPRNKLLALVSLAYAFLVQLLSDERGHLLPALLRWAHRTGRQAHAAYRSLYRLRAGLAALWQRHTPSFQGVP